MVGKIEKLWNDGNIVKKLRMRGYGDKWIYNMPVIV